MKKVDDAARAVRRKFQDAMKAGHPVVHAAKIANGKVEEIPPASPGVEGSAISPPGSAIANGSGDPAGSMATGVVIPENYAAMTWGELQGLSAQISGKPRVQSRKEALAIIATEVEARKTK